MTGPGHGEPETHPPWHPRALMGSPEVRVPGNRPWPPPHSLSTPMGAGEERGKLNEQMNPSSPSSQISLSDSLLASLPWTHIPFPPPSRASPSPPPPHTHSHSSVPRQLDQLSLSRRGDRESPRGFTRFPPSQAGAQHFLSVPLDGFQPGPGTVLMGEAVRMGREALGTGEGKPGGRGSGWEGPCPGPWEASHSPIRAASAVPGRLVPSQHLGSVLQPPTPRKPVRHRQH